MMLLELVHRFPNWAAALEVALTRPPGVPERRANEDPWALPIARRPRRISDDLLWLRRAYDEPADHGLRALDGAPVWEAHDETMRERLDRLEQRGVLQAAGFLLHESDAVAT